MQRRKEQLNLESPHHDLVGAKTGQMSFPATWFQPAQELRQLSDLKENSPRLLQK